jgi:DUF1365 family protein
VTLPFVLKKIVEKHTNKVDVSAFSTLECKISWHCPYKVEGLMIGLELSPDNKFAAAYTNNNQTILLNTLISEFFIIDNPLGK